MVAWKLKKKYALYSWWTTLKKEKQWNSGQWSNITEIIYGNTHYGIQITISIFTKEHAEVTTHPAFTCSIVTIETLG